MPNEKASPKDRINAAAQNGLADLKRATDKHPELELDPDLKSVKESLTVIAMDNHHAS